MWLEAIFKVKLNMFQNASEKSQPPFSFFFFNLKNSDCSDFTDQEQALTACQTSNKCMFGLQGWMDFSCSRLWVTTLDYDLHCWFGMVFMQDIPPIYPGLGAILQHAGSYYTLSVLVCYQRLPLHHEHCVLRLKVKRGPLIKCFVCINCHTNKLQPYYIIFFLIYLSGLFLEECLQVPNSVVVLVVENQPGCLMA